MTDLALLGLAVAEEDPCQWELPVVGSICSKVGQLWGGCGLAAALTILESQTGRRTVCASAQYSRSAPEGARLRFETNMVAVGSRITQARAIARNGENEVLIVSAVLGQRPSDEYRTLTSAPSVPPPEKCQRLDGLAAEVGLLGERLEVRLARGRQWGSFNGDAGSGQVCLWSRLNDAVETTTAGLAIMGDLVPSGVADARGVFGGGASLDNTLRIIDPQPSEWVLCEIGIDAVVRGFAHGWERLWSMDGTLMATASQTVVCRALSEHNSR